MPSWFINKECSPDIQDAFSHFDKIIDLKNSEVVSSSSISQVSKLLINNKIFYIKQYHARGKKLRKWYGRSRCRAEWLNLIFCRDLGIKVPKLVAYGERKASLLSNSYHGIIITEEVKNATDLKSIAINNVDLIKKRNWRRQVITILAEYVRKLHQNYFIHYDLQWRNILVTNSNDPNVFLFDIPCGRIRMFSYNHGIKRDFYNLYKSAKQYINRTDILRFYLYYKNSIKLTPSDKQFIKKIILYYNKKEIEDARKLSTVI